MDATDCRRANVCLRVLVALLPLMSTVTSVASAQVVRGGHVIRQRQISPRGETTFVRPFQGGTIPLFRHVPNENCLTTIAATKARFIADSARRRVRPDSMARVYAADSNMRVARSCAYMDDSARRVVMFEIQKEELLRAARVHNEIPEYHDEQRLSTDDRNDTGLMKLGPVAGIYASPFVMNFSALWQIRAHGRPGLLVGYVVVVQENLETLPASYQRLNLRFGMNCIFLEATSLLVAQYRAWVTHPKADQPCRDEHGATATPSGSALPVIVTQTGFAQHDMIGAARLLDDTQGRTVLGFPCLGDWCQIGEQNFTPVKATYCDWFTPAPTNVPCEANREARIPSWYDEQYWDEKHGNDWVATNLRVAIVPQPSISRFSDADFSDTLRHVANLYIRERLPTSHKLYFYGARQGENRIELRRISADRKWEYIITPITNPLPAGTPPISVTVLGPHKHWDDVVPGTARFRYTQRDPGIWSACGSSCCRTD